MFSTKNLSFRFALILLLKNFKSSIGTFILLYMILYMMGCGYNFRATGVPMGIEIKSIAIPLIKSSSSMLGFEGIFTKVIRDEFISHAKIPLVSRDKADAVLLGTVYGIISDPNRYSIETHTINDNEVNYEETMGRELKVVFDVKLIYRSTGKVIWKEKGMDTKTSYAVSSDPLINRHYKRNAVKAIASTFASRIYNKTMERF